MKIKDIIAREILDSRGNPTIEVDVRLENNIIGRAAVPSGASTGSNEAFELRDGDMLRYFGMGIKKAIHSVEIIKESLIGRIAGDYNEIDQIMIDLDGTKNKSNLGANAILAVSLAVAKAAANSLKQPLYYFLSDKKTDFQMPTPMMNIINGGAHANNLIDIQEFMVVPSLSKNFAESLRKGAEIFHQLKKNLKKMNHSTNVGDEGGFAPNISSANEAIEIILQAAKDAGYAYNKDYMISLDVAASELYKNGEYNFVRSGKKYNIDELIAYYKDLTEKYPILSIEDPFDESDFQGWKKFTEIMKDKLTIVGDDIFVTNPVIFESCINQSIANAILIKPNQIGTISETKRAIDIAKRNGYKTIMSHRSGETEDISIAHLAVAFNTEYIKAGSLSRTDRVAKYNELIRIEEEFLLFL